MPRFLSIAILATISLSDNSIAIGTHPSRIQPLGSNDSKAKLNILSQTSSTSPLFHSHGHATHTLNARALSTGATAGLATGLSLGILFILMTVFFVRRAWYHDGGGDMPSAKIYKAARHASYEKNGERDKAEDKGTGGEETKAADEYKYKNGRGDEDREEEE
ncbi:hypothetical protein F5Y19DRAFT_479297 [Xylariaceae sp. FL1651]|nr:hypothetical protein F5Y19DRAFT_479297 [Xylariaceae sp. FL1651]